MWKTRGHDAAIELLKSSLTQDRVSHAYLIAGPERIGKSTLARELGMALNCTAWQSSPGLFAEAEAPAAEPGPCYQCSNCLKALAGSHPDLRVIEEWTTERGSLPQQIRALEYGVSLQPFEGRWKVLVLLNAQDLTDAGQNTLLKTLEEPAPHTCIILVATSPQMLLPTVVSRCQQIQLRPPSTEAIAAALIELQEVGPEQAHMLAALAGGRVGWALDAAQEPSLLEQRQAVLTALAQALEGGTVKRFRLAEALAGSDPQAIDDALVLWLSWLRDVLLVVEGCPERIVNRDQQAEIEIAARQLESQDLQAAIRAVQAARAQVAGAINTRMALEVLMLRLPPVTSPARPDPARPAR
jgi:DNA polymerase-3 subunit delta'